MRIYVEFVVPDADEAFNAQPMRDLKLVVIDVLRKQPRACNDDWANTTAQRRDDRPHASVRNNTRSSSHVAYLIVVVHPLMPFSYPIAGRSVPVLDYNAIRQGKRLDALQRAWEGMLVRPERHKDHRSVPS
jgi:hypothetical protein